MLQLILDVETKQTFDQVGGYFPEKLGISYVGTCVRENFHQKGEMKGYFEHELDQLFRLLERVDLVVGFNIIGFDLPALSSYAPGLKMQELPTLDLMARIKDSVGHRIGLDAVATDTLGVGKTGDGLDAIKYYQNKEFDKLSAYCLHDVEVTRDVLDYGHSKGLIKFRNKWNRLIECPVDFTTLPKRDLGTQMSLI